jgi:hypothetical protein
MARLFKAYKFIPKLFHADECSGVGFIGVFLISTAWFAIILSVWVLYVIFFPAVFSGTFNFSVMFMFYLVCVSIGLPIFVLIPGISVHRAMYRARDEHLLYLRDRLSVNIPDDSTTLSDAVARLDMFAHIEKAHVLVPFPRRRMILFVLTAVTPAVLGVSSLIFQVLQDLANLAAPHS